MTITHLSPSSLTLFKAQPSLWVLRYLKGARDEAGPAAWRGSAVEAGLDAFLFKQQDFYERAMARFEQDAMGDASEDVAKQRALVKPILNHACDASLEASIPISRQHRIEYWLDDIPWPVIGFADYLMPETVDDLKTTERMPSEPKADHLLQVSLYAAATEKPARLLYATPKKYQWFDITPEQQEAGMKEARAIARNIKALLALSTNPDTLFRALPSDFENFRWSTATKQFALQMMES